MARADYASLRVDLQVIGTGAALPGPALGTAELLQRVADFVSPADRALAAAVARRMGIRARHVARDFKQAIEAARAQQDAPHLAAHAVDAALTDSGKSAQDLRFLIGHTTTPHTLLPANIAWAADLLHYAGPHLEIRQACTGFAGSALTAAAFCSVGIGPVAIVGSECGSCLFDPRHIASDRGQLINLVQMGDGAGAIVLGPRENPAASRIEHLFYGSLGLHRQPGISIPEGGSGSPLVSTKVTHFAHQFENIRAHGLELLRAGLLACAEAGFDKSNVDWWIPHQANGKIAAICARHLQLPADRTVSDAGELGNLGSAAIWVSLDRLRRSGRLRPGERVAVLGAEASKFMYGGLIYVHGEN